MARQKQIRRSFGSVRKLPSGRWQARTWDPQTGARITSPKTYETKTEATLWLDGKRNPAEQGEDLDERAARTALKAWWPGYLDSIQRRLRPSTVASYEQAWRLRVEPTFGNTEVRQIKPMRIDEWVGAMSEQGLAPTKIHQASGVLKRLLDRAVRDGALASNPFQRRLEPLPKLPTIERPVLEPSEVFEIAAATNHDSDALLIRTLMYLGLRIGEALGLQRGDINLKAQTVTIRRSIGHDSKGKLVVSETKTGRTRTIPLPGQLARELTQHLKLQVSEEGLLPGRTDPVFPSKVGGYRRYRGFLRDVWRPAIKKANEARADRDAKLAKRTGRPVKVTPKLECTPHDLRGTCASLLIDSGASVRDVADFLGHADITTTLSLYTRVRPGRAADVAIRMDELVNASVSATKR